MFSRGHAYWWWITELGALGDSHESVEEGGLLCILMEYLGWPAACGSGVASAIRGLPSAWSCNLRTEEGGTQKLKQTLHENAGKFKESIPRHLMKTRLVGNVATLTETKRLVQKNLVLICQTSPFC